VPAAQVAGQLPFTGLNALWLLLIGGALLGGGAVMRTRLS
jgi:LPXTG-motif cell wall-anchored protein